MRAMIGLLSFACVFTMPACERSADTPPSSPPASTAPPKGDSASQKAPEKDAGAKDTPSARPGHSGGVIELGTTKIGEYSVRASRDQGEIKPGGDAPIDVWVDGGLGEGVTVVRFWIGTEDAKGSVKAKAAVEDGKWHTHVEIPDPLPADSALWIELESPAGVAKGSVPI